jgi:hypothetical protein
MIIEKIDWILEYHRLDVNEGNLNLLKA